MIAQLSGQTRADGKQIIWLLMKFWLGNWKDVSFFSVTPFTALSQIFTKYAAAGHFQQLPLQVRQFLKKQDLFWPQRNP